MNCCRIVHQSVQRIPDPAAVAIQLVKRAGPRQHLKRTLTHALQIHPPRQIKQCGKGLVHTIDLSTFSDQFHGLDAHVLQCAQRIDKRPVHHLERRIRPVHARRHPRQFQSFADLFKIHRQLVSQVDIAVHHTGHKFDRVVRLEPSGLIADHGIGRGMRFVKTVVGEFFQKVEDF